MLVQTGVDYVDRKDVSELFLFISSGVGRAMVHFGTRVLYASSTSGLFGLWTTEETLQEDSN